MNATDSGSLTQPSSRGRGRLGASGRVEVTGLVLLLLLSAHTALAAESPPVRTAHTTASLITSTDATAPGTPLTAGLRLQMAPGWHTYWQNPGDAGFPPNLTIQLPTGGTAGDLTWPAPQRLTEGTVTAFGYTEDLVLPFSVTPAAGALRMEAHASWLVCRDICIPEDADLAINLPLGTPVASPQAPLLAAATATVPQPGKFAASLTPDGALTLSGAGLPDAVTAAEFFPLADGRTELLGPQTPTRHGGTLTLRTKLSPVPGPSAPVAGVVALTAAAGTQAFTVSARPAPALAHAQTPWLLLLPAFAGGLLLNLMPCVFPVLAMKAMALARMSGATRRSIRQEAASYTAGAVVSFAAVGLGLAALRSWGQAAGWGYQFQSPVFVTAVGWLLFATGLNLSGVFEFGAGLVGAGQSAAGRGGHAGSFFTGVLAVVVATPCTAPFMGAAVAGALAAPPAGTALVFAAMGLGLALPYALVAAMPEAARLLPRPGAWMITLRQALAFPMYAAAAWLLWVASQQGGPSAVLVAAFGFVAVGLAAWLLGVSQASRRRGRWFGQLGAVAAVGVAVAVLLAGQAPAAETSEPFSATRLAELRREGRPVFVNMTAAWCLSCLVNERLALAPQATRDAFARSHVAYLKGDWTRQDPAISAFLHDHGRDGVPLYVFYPPGHDPDVLPQVLTESTLLHELAQAGS